MYKLQYAYPINWMILIFQKDMKKTILINF